MIYHPQQPLTHYDVMELVKHTAVINGITKELYEQLPPNVQRKFDSPLTNSAAHLDALDQHGIDRGPTNSSRDMDPLDYPYRILMPSDLRIDKCNHFDIGLADAICTHTMSISEDTTRYRCIMPFAVKTTEKSAIRFLTDYLSAHETDQRQFDFQHYSPQHRIVVIDMLIRTKPARRTF